MAFNCVRCGFCCIIPSVLIVRPEYVDENIKIHKSFVYFDKVMMKESGKTCPHLKFNDKTGNSSCIVHDKPWFKDTVCGNFQTFEEPWAWFPEKLITENEGCRIGNFVKKNFPKNWYKDWWVWVPNEIVSMRGR